MRRRTLVIPVLVGLPLAGLIYWLASSTYWGEVAVPLPPKGEALTNPSYAAQRVALALGASASRDRVFVAPSPNSVILLSSWNWDLSPLRRRGIEHWVESGGRLVVDDTNITGDEFEQWSGIIWEFPDDDGNKGPDGGPPLCRRFTQELNGSPVPDGAHTLCDMSGFSFLAKRGTAPEWALRDARSGMQALRTRVGRGSVTVVNGDPFRNRGIFNGDHGWLFVAAAQLKPGDSVHFLSEDDYPSLLMLAWQGGGPVVALALGLIALLLWRGAVRFGPIAQPPPAARRSIAEQVRGTGQFALHHGGGEALHAAAVRALDEAARTRIPGYAHLQGQERAGALARLTGIDQNALTVAIYHPRMRRAQELRGTIAVIEAARRRTLLTQTGSTHGT